MSVLFLIYTILVALTASLYQPASRDSVGLIATPAAGITTLFLIFLFMQVSIINSFKKSHHKLEEQNAFLEKEKEDAKLSLEDENEKRTLEIAVINGSLNREIAERMQAESEALELKKQMELILNSAGEGIFGLDIEGNVTFVNTSAQIMIGWDKDELIGKSHHELVHHSQADGTPIDSKACPIRQTFTDGLVHSCSDDVFWSKDGTSFPVEYVSTPIIEESRICGAVVVFRDTSTFT